MTQFFQCAISVPLGDTDLSSFCLRSILVDFTFLGIISLLWCVLAASADLLLIFFSHLVHCRCLFYSPCYFYFLKCIILYVLLLMTLQGLFLPPPDAAENALFLGELVAFWFFLVALSLPLLRTDRLLQSQFEGYTTLGLSSHRGLNIAFPPHPEEAKSPFLPNTSMELIFQAP